MKIEIIIITPQIASEYLSFNADNRPLRRTVVDGYKAAFMRGEYVMTHQGIAFNEAGILSDGQHRLTAISEMRDGSFPMIVTRGLSDDAFKNIDGGVKRSAADALKEDKKLVEAARLIAVLSSKGESRSAPSVAMLIPYVDEIAYDHMELMGAYAGTVKTWSSAPVRVAAIICIRKGIDIDYVKSIYRMLASRDLDAMPSVARSLFKAEASGAVKARNAVDMLGRCLSVFDPKKAHNKIIKVYSTASTYAIVRDSFSEIVSAQNKMLTDGRGEKKATQTGVAKSISRPNYLTATR